MDTHKKIDPSVQKHLAELKQIFRESGGVVSAYLFGSIAEGVQNRFSDVDIAVRLKPGLNPMDKHRIRMHLIGTIEGILEKDVDVVVLNDASLKMVHQVFRRGISIYVGNDQQEEEFRLKMQKTYFDFQYYLEKERRDLRAFYDR